MERKEAKAGNYAEARRYNAIRMANTPDQKSYAYATCLYDRFMISYHYEGKLKGEDVDDLLQAAIIELEYSNRDINSMLIVVTLLNDIGEVEDAKRVSDYYDASLLKFGSRKRLLECGEKAMVINEENFRMLQKKNNQFKLAILFISLMAVALLFALLKINSSRNKIISLNKIRENIHKGRIKMMEKVLSLI